MSSLPSTGALNLSSPVQTAPTTVPDPAAALGQTLDLRDIHLPGEPAFWPPAPGWWLALTLLLAALATALIAGLRRWRRLRRKRAILAELDRLGTAEQQGPGLAAAVSTLLKRVALSRYRRAEVAALTGEAWLAFLDRTGGSGRFAQGAGRYLAEGPYAPDGQPMDAEGLLEVARDWIRRNS